MSVLAPKATESANVGGLFLSERLRSSAELTARLLLAAVFFYSAIAKIQDYGGVAAYMSSYGVPGSLLPLVLVTEVLLPVALIIGWQTRLATFLLLGYSVLAVGIFHHNFADPKETLAFFETLGLIAALLLLLVYGAGPLSLDRRLARLGPSTRT